MFQPDGKLFSSGLRSRGGARGQIAEHRDRLLEQSAVLLVKRGMDQLGLDFGRYFGGRARAISLLRHHLLDGLDSVSYTHLTLPTKA